MIIQRFLAWSRTASAGARAEAASALANAWLYSDLDPQQREEALPALTILLDDAAPLVRRALAEAFASAADAPAHVIVALAHDQSDISAPVLARSPALRDADLVDCVAVGDQRAHIAIACRAELSSGVCGALAEIAEATALVALMRNRSAHIPEFAYRRALERHGAAAELRESMLARSDLPAGVRHMLVVAVSSALADFAESCAWMRPEQSRRVVAEARESAALAIAGETGACAALVDHLREAGHLTAGLLLRALLSGRVDLVEAALANLTEQPTRRVAGILSDRRGAGFAALYRKAGLPDGLFPAFQAALAAWRDLERGAPETARSTALSRRLIERTLTAIEDAPMSENAVLFAMLRRFEAEAARDDARSFIAELMSEPFDELDSDIRRLVEETARAAGMSAAA